MHWICWSLITHSIEVTAVSVVRWTCTSLGRGVATVNAQLGAGHVAGGVGEEESDGAHEVLRLAHLALGNERDPLLGELGVLVKDLLGAIETKLSAACVVTVLG